MMKRQTSILDFVKSNRTTSTRISTNLNIIINRFRTHIKDVSIPKPAHKHDGSDGHWLEKQFGVSANSSNRPDMFGIEIKKYSNVITFGDFSASEYIFSRHHPYLNKINQCNIPMDRQTFFMLFGSFNTSKNRWSWSGRCVPKYNTFTDGGLRLIINDDDQNLCIYYHPECDKIHTPPLFMKRICICVWKYTDLTKCVNQKFNCGGFVICEKNTHKNSYTKVYVGNPFDIRTFINGIKSGYIYLDSGMYDGNSRNYSQFRASHKYWLSLTYTSYD